MFKFFNTFAKKQLYYIVEPAEWSIKWDGRYVTEEINAQYALKACIRESHQRIKNSIIHFGSRNLYFMTDAYQGIHQTNRVVFTWFHGTEEDTDFIKALPEGSKNADLIHTSCTISNDQLVRWGAEADKIVTIPLGVDTSLFKPIEENEKNARRAKEGIPPGHVVIGSFQKDGNGWEAGLEPKMIKGPDIFCDVVEQLNQQYPIFVFLTGPARGYVKKRLEDANIPYKHVFLRDYQDVAYYYTLLDVYLITSRAEGGPKALLESWASGIPVISTRVGMCADLIQHQKNGLLAEVGDRSALFSHTKNLIKDGKLASQLVQSAQRTVQEYRWGNIAKKYYEQIYSKLL